MKDVMTATAVRSAVTELRAMALWTALVLSVLCLWNVAAAAEPPSAAEESETATFSMYCYWTGEATLGRVEGVLASRIGHWGGSEIVQVDYDPRRTDPSELVRALKRQRSFYSAIVANDAERAAAGRYLDNGEIALQSGEPRFIEAKHSLRTRHPELYRLDLTERQAIQLNSWSYFGGPKPNVLDAEQKRRLERAERN